MHSERCDSRKASLARSAAGINNSLFHNVIRVFIRALMHEIEFGMSENMLLKIRSILRLFQDLSVINEHGTKGIMSLLACAYRKLVTSLYVIFVSHYQISSMTDVPSSPIVHFHFSLKRSFPFSTAGSESHEPVLNSPSAFMC